jgi:glutamate dehydrogenase/leucine dehydrogenase
VVDASPAMEDLLSRWDGDLVATHRDRRTDTWMFVCVHSQRLGPAGGGCRLRHYPQPADALADGLRLAEAMTLKFASADLPMGGGKAVIAPPTAQLPAGEERRRLLHEFGAFLRSMGGLYSCAPDMNTSAADMDVIAEVCPYVYCRTEAAGGSGDTAPDTAIGVLHGIRAGCRFAFGSADLVGRTVVVQGAGGVGGRLIDLLQAAGAEVMAADTDPARAAQLDDAGVTVVAPEVALTTTCDVLAPCATGGVISARSVPRLRCRVVAGGANNQLEKQADADLLAERGILYAPDFVINAGGVLHGCGLEVLGWSRETLDARLAGIGDVLYEIFRAADGGHISTDAAARKLAQARLDSADAKT